MQRNLIEGDNWPADEIDDNPDRYIEFGIKPNAGNDLNINNISFYLCGAGGNGMCAHVYYSTDNFVTRTTIFEGKKMTANNPVLVQSQPVLTVKDGQQLLVRIYPWYNGAATGKTLCISDVTIGGMAVDTTTAIRQMNSGNTMTTSFFTLDGCQQSSPRRGLNIIRMADGQTKKIVY
jgi:hypothetical protein